MKVYHGTSLQSALDIKDNGIDLNKSKPFLDFGKGFYTSPDFQMCKEMVKRKVDLNKELGAVIVFDYNYLFAKESGCNIKFFPKDTIEWRKFVIANRLPSNLIDKYQFLDYNDGRYDICNGLTADGTIAITASNIRKQKIKYTEECISNDVFLQPYDNQISFHTALSLKSITYKEIIIIKEV